MLVRIWRLEVRKVDKRSWSSDFIKMGDRRRWGAALRDDRQPNCNHHPVIVTEFSPTRMPTVSPDHQAEFSR